MESTIRCVNCHSEFAIKEKGFKRTALVSDKRSENVVEEVFGVSDLTPRLQKKDARFLCDNCERLMKSASAGHQAKQELFTKTSEESYIGRKRKHQEPSTSTKDIIISSTPVKLRKKSSTPKKPTETAKFTPKKKEVRLSSGARYFSAFKYKQGFKYYLSKSGSAFKALRELLSKRSRKDMKKLLDSGTLPNMKSASLNNFKRMNMKQLVKFLKTSVPLLYDALVTAMTAKKGHVNREDMDVVLGMITCMVTGQARPRRASLMQQMNSVQMWRAGCKRSLFHIFNRMGICSSESAMRNTLDKLKVSFDKELMNWKSELQKYVFPEFPDPTPSSEDEVIQSSPLLSEIHSGSPATSAVSEEVSSISHTDSPDPLPSSIGSPAGSTPSEIDEDLEWVDISDDEENEGDATIPYGAPMPKGYTLCWDNVGKQVKARRQTRNHGNKYKNWALAFAVKNRVCTTQYKGTSTTAACDIPLECYFLNDRDKENVRERLINIVQRIMVKYLKMYQAVAHLPTECIPHVYDKESCQKSEMFNIGVIDENPSSTAGVIKILESLHKYVPINADGTLFPLVVWGDGLSCERHKYAQNARANADSPTTKLQGLQPGAQEFHKRMLLLQDVMDKLFTGKSAMDKGTLFHLKNVFNQRSVTSNVSDSFNYVSDFIKFVTEGYVILLAMDGLQLKDIEDDGDAQDLEVSLNDISEHIVDRVWNLPEMKPTADQKRCFCREESEEDETMIECDNDECEEGGWFHLLCVGLSEDNLPEEWFCSEKCRQYVMKYCRCKQHLKGVLMVECCNVKCKFGQWFHAKCVGLQKGSLPKKDEKWYCSQECRKTDRDTPTSNTDHVWEYTKMITWAGLNDMLRREAVRHNDGPMMTTFWKMDMPLFFSRNHTKYFVLGHRLLTALNGFLPERLRQDLIWNRTVNIKGGRGSNDETDLVNEFLNKEFKESIRGLGAQTTQQSLERHGKLTGGLGKVLDDTYVQMVEGSSDRPAKRTTLCRKEGMSFFVETLQACQLTKEIGGRAHKAFPKINSRIVINKQSCIDRITRLSKKLDKAKRVADN